MRVIDHFVFLVNGPFSHSQVPLLIFWNALSSFSLSDIKKSHKLSYLNCLHNVFFFLSFYFLPFFLHIESVLIMYENLCFLISMLGLLTFNVSISIFRLGHLGVCFTIFHVLFVPAMFLYCFFLVIQVFFSIVFISSIDMFVFFVSYFSRDSNMHL